MRILVITVLFTVGMACSSTSVETPENDPEVLILGTWVVQSAQVDDTVYPLTSPGFGQVQAKFDNETFTYIYPERDSFGLPTENTDTLIAHWSFNASLDSLTFSIPNTNQVILKWHIESLGIGKMSTNYNSESANDPNQVSRYKIDYRLD